MRGAAEMAEFQQKGWVAGNGFSVLSGLGNQQLKLMLGMGTADVLEGGSLLPFVLDYLDGSRPRCCPNCSDCQVSAHGRKIPLVRKLKNRKILTANKI